MDSKFWAEFEARLADFDSDSLVQDASAFLNSHGADDWSDADNHAFQYDINEAVRAISVRMRARFGEWIRRLPMPTPSATDGKRLTIDPSACFLNFNYTTSLQDIYGVPDAQILFVHGSVGDPDGKLVLGHGREPPADLDPYRFEQDPETADVRVIEGQSIIDRYFRDTFKPTAAIVRNNASFFGRLAGVDEIFVLGHSMSEVDHPYFLEVMRNVDLARVRWTISYYDDVSKMQEQVATLNIPLGQVEYIRLQDLSQGR
jgi:hypothetical protein